MYAVVKTGGKQYRVAVGDRLRVDKLDSKAGASVALGEVLMVADGDQVSVGTPALDTSVTATVVSHGKADKIKVFKMRRRKNYRRTQGHRQDFTEVEITSIGDSGKPKKSRSAKKAEAPEADSVAPAPEPDTAVSDESNSGKDETPDS